MDDGIELNIISFTIRHKKFINEELLQWID